MFSYLIINKKHKVFYCGTILFLYAALRGNNVGIDTESYLQAFDYLNNITFLEIFSTNVLGISRDPLFYCFAKIFINLFGYSQVVLGVISATVAICISYLIYRYSDDCTLSFLTFIGLRFFSFSMTGLRGIMALSILILSIKFIEDKKPVRFFIIVILASLFHSSAIVFLVVYLLSKTKKFFPVFLLTGISLIYLYNYPSILVIIMAKTPLLLNYASYIENMEIEYTGLSIIIVYVSLIIGFFFTDYYWNNCNKNKNINIIFVFQSAIIIGTGFQIANFNFANLSRVGDYFCIFIVIMLPNILRHIYVGKNLKMTLIIFTIILIVLQYIVIGPGAGTNNYTFFWNI